MMCSVQVAAQDYQPFPSEYARWAYRTQLEAFAYWTLYYLNGDTTINQTIYHVLNRRQLHERSHNINVLDDIYFREESKRIYFKNIDYTEEEILTYDFKLTVGDTFYLKNVDTLVVKVDYTEDGRRILKLESFNLEYEGIKITDTWIEGIGSNSNLLKPDFFSGLMCFKGDNDRFASCGYIDEILAVPAPVIAKSQNRVYPNPVSDKLYFQVNNNRYNTYKIFDIQGKLMKLKEIEENFIDVSSIPEGTYLLQLIGKDGLPVTDFFEKINHR